MKRLMIFVFISVLTLSCQSRKYRAPENPEFLFNQAMELFNARKFSKAAELFRSFVFNYPLSDSVDDAQYYLAKSYKESERIDDATTEYLFLINTFPSSEFIEKAYLELADCYLVKSKNVTRDTESLSQAQSYLDQFKSRFPDSPLIDKAKELEKNIYRLKGLKYTYIAESYLRIGEPKSASVYLDIVQREFQDDDSLLTLAKILSAQGLAMIGDCDSARKIMKQLEQSNAYNDRRLESQFNKAKKELQKRCQE